MADPARVLARIIANRRRHERDLSMTALIDRIEQTTRSTEKRLGQLIPLWEEVVPPELAVHTKLAGLRQGVLDVIVDSAPARYELDRHLRSGGEHALRARYRGTLRKIRIRLGAIVAEG
jgi:hypothetical protein